MNKVFVLALFLSGCATPGKKEMPPVALLETNVKEIANNLVEPDREKLSQLAHEKLTYGHSSGNIENKAQFIEALFGGTDILSWEMSDMQKEVVGNTAWVRHNLEADMINNGDTSSIQLKVMMVWVYENEKWQLIARQAVK